MFRLVSAGQARPGQTGWEILDSMAFDVLTDFAYGMLVEHMEPADRKRLDETLALAADKVRGRQPVLVRRSSGEVVQISEARLAQIKRNMAGMGRISRGKRKERQR